MRCYLLVRNLHTHNSMSRAEEAERRRQAQEELERQRHQQLTAKLEVTI